MLSKFEGTEKPCCQDLLTTTDIYGFTAEMSK